MGGKSMRVKRLMARLVLRLEARDHERLKAQAAAAGTTAASLAREVLKDRMDATAIAEVVGDVVAERVAKAADAGMTLLANQTTEVVREEVRQAFTAFEERFEEAVGHMSRAVELVETAYGGRLTKRPSAAVPGAKPTGAGTFDGLPKIQKE